MESFGLSKVSSGRVVMMILNDLKMEFLIVRDVPTAIEM